MAWKFYNSNGEERISAATGIGTEAGQIPVWDGEAWTTDFPDTKLLYDVTLSSNVSSVDMQNIPQTFTHLRLFFHGSMTAAGPQWLSFRLNNNSSTVYDYIFHIRGSVEIEGEGNSSNRGLLAHAYGTANNANAVMACDVAILDYTTTAYYQETLTQYTSDWSGATNSADGRRVGSVGTLWRQKAAVNQVTVVPDTGLLNTGTRISLYGLKT